MQPPVRLELRVREDVLPRFCLLTGGGFTVRARTACSIWDLLCGQLGIAPDYLETRIQTIFLNGKVVDDPKIAKVRPASTIALSAAMPGIAGAMFRKDSPYAPMRNKISDAGQDSKRVADCQCDVVVKLFNAVQAELGILLLRRGVSIAGKSVSSLFRGREKAFGAGIMTVRLDDAAISPNDIFEMDWQERRILLRVTG